MAGVEEVDKFFRDFVRAIGDYAIEQQKKESGHCRHQWGGMTPFESNHIQTCKKCGLVRRVL